jgi:hypothetical protein
MDTNVLIFRNCCLVAFVASLLIVAIAVTNEVGDPPTDAGCANHKGSGEVQPLDTAGNQKPDKLICPDGAVVDLR